MGIYIYVYIDIYNIGIPKRDFIIQRTIGTFNLMIGWRLYRFNILGFNITGFTFKTLWGSYRDSKEFCPGYPWMSFLLGLKDSRRKFQGDLIKFQHELKKHGCGVRRFAALLSVLKKERWSRRNMRVIFDSNFHEKRQILRRSIQCVQHPMCVQVQEKILRLYAVASCVCKCKRRSYDVASSVCVCVQVQEKILRLYAVL